MSSCKLLTVIAIIALWTVSFSPASAQIITAPDSAPWPLKPGVKSFGSMLAQESTLTPGSKIFTSFGISFGPETHVLIPAGKVRIGPIKLSYANAVLPLQPRSVYFKVTVLGRSPSEPGAVVPPLRQLAHVSKVLGGKGGSYSDEFNFDVKLPGVLTAIQVVGEVGQSFASGPGLSKTVYFPSKNCSEIAGDADCAQIAMQPTARIEPNVLPIALLYEPPGNCSGASFTQTQTVGDSVLIEQSESTTEGIVSERRFLPFLPDIEPLKGIRMDETEKYQETKESSTSKRSQVFFAQKYGDGTLLGVPSPGEPRTKCVDTQGRSPKGPGKGDFFYLLVKPSFIFWDTGILSNFRLAQNQAAEILPLNALQIAQNNLGNLSDFGITLSDAARLAILSLDPFFDPQSFLPRLTPDEIKAFRRFQGVAEADLPYGGSSQPLPMLDPSRFTCMPLTIIANPESKGVQLSTQKETQLTYAKKISTENMSTESPEVREDAAPKLAIAGSAAVITGLAGGNGFSTFKEVSDAFDKYVSSDKETVTTTVSFARSTRRESVQGDILNQDFFIHDDQRFLRVRIYYDKMFGTYAFQNTNAGCVETSTPSAPAHTEFTRDMTLALSGAVNAALPPKLMANLEALSDQTAGGGVTFRLAPTAEYEAASNFIQGLPQGLHLDAQNGTLEGSLSGTQPGDYQALVSVSDSSNEEFAQLWLNIAVNELGDLDGDSDVDIDDVKILLADRGKSVEDSVCGVACDLDGDGRITALDARKLQLLCTRPQCATQ